MRYAPIGVFDSGYGGLTVFKHIRELMPQYDYIYLGDNARNPYGTRSFDVVYQYTLEAVEKLFSMGCELVILACNTASAKALRTIQQNDLERIAPNKRVLGVIRPSVEVIGENQAKHVGILGTDGTVRSKSYSLEIQKLFPHIKVTQEACPMWVPLVENREYDKPGADYYIKQHIKNILNRGVDIDTLILGCTHYPLLIDKIREHVPDEITILSQGELVARKLKLYLNNHPEMEERCSILPNARFYTTESPDKFKDAAQFFLGKAITVAHIEL